MVEGETYAVIDKAKQRLCRANDTVADDTVMWENDDLYDATGVQTTFSTESKHGECNSNTAVKGHRNLNSSPEEETVMEENDDLYDQP